MAGKGDKDRTKNHRSYWEADYWKTKESDKSDDDPEDDKEEK
jgi:hypothetical protein